MSGKRIVIVLCLAPILLEATIRTSRVDDTPLYRADKRIGYIPAPNQSGAFLWTHRWSFNELSMGTPEHFQPGLPNSVLLVGDSIVLGGNPYRAEERLGPQLAMISNRPVWPISAGSWSLQNELQYLMDHPQVIKGVEQVVLVSNSGDFEKPSSWSNELTHPRLRHISSALQFVRKFIFGVGNPVVPSSLAVTLRDLSQMLQSVSVHLRRPMIVIAFPTKSEEQGESFCGFPIPRVFTSNGIRVYCLKQTLGWSDTMYRDGIHPTSQGMRVTASFIASVLTRAAEDSHGTVPISKGQ